jgi:hypothetical protein
VPDIWTTSPSVYLTLSVRIEIDGLSSLMGLKLGLGHLKSEGKPCTEKLNNEQILMVMSINIR